MNKFQKASYLGAAFAVAAKAVDICLNGGAAAPGLSNAADAYRTLWPLALGYFPGYLLGARILFRPSSAPTLDAK
jgi:hypothetical protein